MRKESTSQVVMCQISLSNTVKRTTNQGQNYPTHNLLHCGAKVEPIWMGIKSCICSRTAHWRARVLVNSRIAISLFFDANIPAQFKRLKMHIKDTFERWYTWISGWNTASCFLRHSESRENWERIVRVVQNLSVLMSTNEHLFPDWKSIRIHENAKQCMKLKCGSKLCKQSSEKSPALKLKTVWYNWTKGCYPLLYRCISLRVTL